MLDVNDPVTLKRYLFERGIIDPRSSVLIEPLAGGVSNSVLKIKSDNGEFVLKQALPKLKVSGEWLSDVERTNIEKKALIFLQNIIPGVTPKLVYEDEINFLLIMECASAGSVTWKSLLMNRDCDVVVARKIGQILGNLHQNTHDLIEAKSTFRNKEFFKQLRIEPYFVILKSKYPDLKKDIEQHIECCLDKEDALITADYSPKNILVCGNNVMVIDFEVTHYGDSSFDLGFLTTHLILKSILFSKRSKDYYAVLKETLEGYFSYVHFTSRAELEKLAVQQLAWLLLARIDGKSPVEYITNEKEKKLIRFAAREILSSNIKRFEEVTEFFTLNKLS